ncbi:MAG: hypothetical protein RIC55_08085 [Pirellulaceae bacterium]
MIRYLYSLDSVECVKTPPPPADAIFARRALADDYARRIEIVAANGFARRAGRLLLESRAVLGPALALQVEHAALGVAHRQRAAQLLAADPLKSEASQ